MAKRSRCNAQRPSVGHTTWVSASCIAPSNANTTPRNDESRCGALDILLFVHPVSYDIK